MRIFSLSFSANLARSLAYQVARIGSGRSPLFMLSSRVFQTNRRTNRQTDRQTDGKVISVA